MKNQKIEGYWYSKYEPEYPKPIPNVLTDQEAKEIYDLIRKKELLCETQFEIGCLRAQKGCSESRITGEKLGSREYRINDWIWPGDFALHYVLKHKIRPTNDFLKFIGYL